MADLHSPINVEKPYNPYQGLKLYIFAGIFFFLYVEKPHNPYQGLKRKTI